VAAADAALVSEFSDQLPDGLNTTVGTGGIGLSGGQRQRVGTRRSGASGRFGQHLLWLQVDRKLVKVGHTDAHQLSDHIAEGGIGLRGSHLDELGHLRLESGHHASARAKGRPAAVSLPDCHSAIIAISCRNSAGDTPHTRKVSELGAVPRADGATPTRIGGLLGPLVCA